MDKISQLPKKPLTAKQLADRIFELQVLLDGVFQNAGKPDKYAYELYFMEQLDSKLCALAEKYDDVSMSFDDVTNKALAGIGL